jgi:hypothetical protein
VGVNVLTDEGGVLGGGDAHDELFALGLGQQGIVQMVVMEKLKASVNES